MTAQVLWREGATKMQEDEANSILEALTLAYPGHPWGVRVYDGGFFIRHLEFDANYGMNCKYGTKLYSASALKREVILMAGEWLERAGLMRGRWNEDPTKHVEGVPEKWQPPEYREKKFVENVIIAADQYTPLREEARPQAIVEAKKEIG